MSDTEGEKKDPLKRLPRSTAEKRTDLIVGKIKEFVLYEYRGKKREPELYFLVEDKPYAIWWATLEKRDRATSDGTGAAASETDETVYFLWDGAEVSQFATLIDAVTEYIASARAKRAEYRWNFFTSPLIISGVIGVVLVLTTSFLLFDAKAVPNQLWSILTAVVAFYFGREGSSKRAAS